MGLEPFHRRRGFAALRLRTTLLASTALLASAL